MNAAPAPFARTRSSAVFVEDSVGSESPYSVLAPEPSPPGETRSPEDHPVERVRHCRPGGRPCNTERLHSRRAPVSGIATSCSDSCAPRREASKPAGTNGISRDTNQREPGARRPQCLPDRQAYPPPAGIRVDLQVLRASLPGRWPPEAGDRTSRRRDQPIHYRLPPTSSSLGRTVQPRRAAPPARIARSSLVHANAAFHSPPSHQHHPSAERSPPRSTAPGYPPAPARPGLLWLTPPDPAGLRKTEPARATGPVPLHRSPCPPHWRPMSSACAGEVPAIGQNAAWIPPVSWRVPFAAPWTSHRLCGGRRPQRDRADRVGRGRRRSLPRIDAIRPPPFGGLVPARGGDLRPNPGSVAQGWTSSSIRCTPRRPAVRWRNSLQECRCTSRDHRR